VAFFPILDHLLDCVNPIVQKGSVQRELDVEAGDETVEKYLKVSNIYMSSFLSWPE
jgi:hypothetical protein